MKQVKHIFFDLDNTLWDFEKNSREALLHLFNEHKIDENCNTNFDNFIEVYEAINHELWHLYSLKQTSKEELRYQRFYKAFLHFNYDNLQLAHHWADDYLKISPYKTHLIDGAMDVLLYLQEKYQLHIITNGFKEVQHIKLDYSNLKPFFEHIIISEEHGFNKPDIKIFDLAQQLTNAQTHECVMIGDNYDADILGALNAQWKAIYLTQTETSNQDSNYVQINRLIDLKELF
ncbi:MAG: noncanonical pyrimidine nucleotidase, YjjG family [Sphingobacteriaceae bacterium]|nr:noncanonical pyrimidine nucleotidase, YjjG family [Sphingobacteriaceae bacterium]